jgi:hypothetical protein
MKRGVQTRSNIYYHSSAIILKKSFNDVVEVVSTDSPHTLMFRHRPFLKLREIIVDSFDYILGIGVTYDGIVLGRSYYPDYSYYLGDHHIYPIYHYIFLAVA